MKKRLFGTLFVFLLLLGAVLVWLGAAQGSNVVSGSIEEGFRVLPVEESEEPLSFNVYRGDYIRFALPEGAGEIVLNFPTLSESRQLGKPGQPVQFVKMKKVGEYSFTLGSKSGVVRVVEYDRPQYSAVTPTEAATLIENVQPFLLDVRTRQEFGMVRLQDAQLIPIQELQRRVGELKGRENDPILIYCATGNRSTVAAKILIDNGFNRIYNLRQGIYNWGREGFPVVR